MVSSKRNILSLFWRPEVWSQCVGRAVISDGSKGEPIIALTSIWWLQVPWLVGAPTQLLSPWSHSLHLHMEFSGLLFYCVQGHVSLDLGPTHNPGWSLLEMLNLITSAKTLFFPNEVTFTHMDIRTWTYLFWGQHSIQYRWEPKCIFIFITF